MERDCGKEETVMLPRIRTGLWSIGLLLLPLFLWSCGGGGGGGSSQPQASTPPAQVATSLFVTDRSADEFAQVFVTVKRVALKRADQTHLLFDDASGIPLNLLELAGEKRLLGVAPLPPGRYEVVITVDNMVTLVEKDGTTREGHFTQDGDFSFNGNGEVTVAEDSPEVVLDFDTRSFDFDPDSGVITPAVTVSPPASATLPFSGKLEGVVMEVTDATNFSLQLEHSTQTVTATLLPGATVLDEASGQTSTTTDLLEAGQKVEVRGDYQPATLHIDAFTVKIDSHRAAPPPSDYVKVEGNIISMGENSFTLGIHEAKGFIPTGGSIEVQVDTSTFIHEDHTHTPLTFADLQPNQMVEVKGTLEGGSILADVIEVKRATVLPPPPPAGTCTTTPSQQWTDFFGTTFPLFSELEGTLSEVSGETITVNGIEVVLVQETILHIDDNGNICPEDLPDFQGNRVEVKVAFAGDTAVAHKVEIKDAGTPAPPPPPPPSAGGEITEIVLDHEGEHPLVHVTGTGWVKVEDKAVITDAQGNFIPPFTLFTDQADFVGKEFVITVGEAENKSEKTSDGRTVTIVLEVKQGQVL
ncbi:MAG: DUF4382 domain-containing protein [Nitrospinota bacterium]|nr:MAG: DUF4382 domain-containing protein [Nitrospinota bacterium]